MSKKMKRVAFDLNQYGDDRARFKHQTLVQDFMELQQETEAAKNNLLALKQKKQTLQAEVSFLWRRHKFLSQNKSTTLQERVNMNTQPARFRKGKKDESLQRAIANRRVRVNGPKGSPIHDLSQKDVFGSHEHLGQSQSQSQTQKPVIDLNRISIEDEELQDHHQPFESLTHGLLQNVGGGSGSESGSGSGASFRLGKRKISWQDSVAIRA